MNSLLISTRWLLARPAASVAQPARLGRLYSTAPSPTPEASTSAAPATEPTPMPTPTPARSSALDAIVSDLSAAAPSAFPSLTSPTPSRDDPARPAHFRHPPSRLASSPSYRTAPPPSFTDPVTHEHAYRFAHHAAYSAPTTPTSARSFAVKNGDLGRAYRMLNRTLMENNVRRELRQQERFESGSDRRVRLNSERHRRRFKVAVGKAVGLAMRMKDL